jgi:CRISPR-associated protein Csx10
MSEHVRITVTLTQPVAAGRNVRADSRQDTHNHIPGSVLRGALAAAWIHRRGQEVTQLPEFLETFEGAGSFGPLHSEASLPVPLSVKRHKYAASENCRSEWDAAYDEHATTCDECEDPLVFSKGQARGRVPLETRTTTALTAEGVARDGHLFTQSMLKEQARLSGWLHGPATRALFCGDEPIHTLSFGSRRSLRGSVTLAVDTTAEPDPVECVGQDVILRLAAPAAFCDDFGFPADQPDLRELSDVLGVEALEVVGAWTRWDEVGGWHAASGLPKPVERAVAAGSTYRIRCAEAPSPESRRTLAARGIGLRRREGFGALYVAPPRPEAHT